MVTSVNDTQARLAYAPDQPSLTVQHFVGDLSVIDKDHEEKFQMSHSERHWKNGAMLEKDPLPTDDIDWINFKKFFDFDPRVVPTNNNFLLNGE